MAAKQETKSKDPEATSYAAVLNILGYQEEGEWVALALEMDLRGYGETFEEALEDLRDLVIMQISFAHFKGQPEMILKRAEPVWFEKYWEARRELLSDYLGSRDSVAAEYLAGGLEIPPAHVIAEIGKGFARTNA